jgi:hypothetical protein
MKLIRFVAVDGSTYVSLVIATGFIPQTKNAGVNCAGRRFEILGFNL